MIRTRPDNKILYLIAGSIDGPVKVGISENPKKRLQQLGTANPTELKIFALATAFNAEDDTAGSAKVLEATAHSLLASTYEKHREWFACSVQEALDFIDNMAESVVWANFFHVEDGLSINGVVRNNT